ncbi:MAG: agmatine deiminase family protein [Pseudomonadota bacterium]
MSLTPAGAEAPNKGSESASGVEAKGEVILMAAPRLDDPYYAEWSEAIIAFQIGLAKALIGSDRAMIFAGEDTAPRYRDALGEGAVVTAPLEDIWIRDYGPVDPGAGTLTRYTAAGQGGGRVGQHEADHVQSRLLAHFSSKGIALPYRELLNDGGNFVGDGAGSAVISRKALRDNRMDETRARQAFKTALGLQRVAFIEADEQGGLEHADGVVAFAGTDTLLVNAYPGDPDYAADLHADLARSLPGVAIHEVVTAYRPTSFFDDRFGSACGIYTNALVTAAAVYLPQFGVAEDAVALEQVRAALNRPDAPGAPAVPVVPIPSAGVCGLGGGVRCLTSQLTGPLAAKTLSSFGLTAPGEGE